MENLRALHSDFVSSIRIVRAHRSIVEKRRPFRGSGREEGGGRGRGMDLSAQSGRVSRDVIERAARKLGKERLQKNSSSVRRPVRFFA